MKSPSIVKYLLLEEEVVESTGQARADRWNEHAKKRTSGRFGVDADDRDERDEDETEDER